MHEIKSLQEFLYPLTLHGALLDKKYKPKISNHSRLKVSNVKSKLLLAKLENYYVQKFHVVLSIPFISIIILLSMKFYFS